jgi:uncharacterized protein (TIGR03437 family)
MQTLANAIFVTVPPGRVAELRTLPGVQAVVPMLTMHPKLNQALNLVGASAAWTALGGGTNAGAGVTIAILDTGIDQTHPGFQDPSLAMPPGFPKFDNPDDAAYTSNKIVAARSFVSLLAIGAGTPELTRPDDLSARDRVGHGTAVAMIAGGVSHQSPIGSISGVAPKAWLGNYKIFGSPGVNDATSADVVLQALEAAFNDGMDIALVSAGDLPALWSPTDQGATCGQTAGVACDPLVGAVSTAAIGGMAIVLPAGNDGENGWGTIDSPGDYTGAITVGATFNAHVVAATVATPSGDQFAARQGDGPQLQAPLTAPLFPVASLDTTGLACSGLSAGALAGTIALVAVGQCSLATKALNAQAAGAAAILLFDQPNAPELLSPAGLSDTGIPAAMVSYTSGGFLLQYAGFNAAPQITINPATSEIGPATGGIVAGFSSQGPTIGDLGIKPDLVAPGVSIYTAAQNYDPNGALYSASRYIGVDGTSFAAAMAAGGAALVKQAHPGYTPGQIQSALANTASAGIAAVDANGNSTPARSIAVGGGQMNVGDAVASTVTSVPASIGFGAVSGGTVAQNLTLTNTGTSILDLALAVSVRDADPNTTVNVSPSSLSLTAGASGNVTVSLAGSGPAPGIYEGVVNVTGGAVPIRIPYLYLQGDGTPFSAAPILDRNFVTEAGSMVNLAFQVLDRYGVPVSNIQTRFSPAASVYLSTPATDTNGIAAAYMTTGQATGDLTFEADLLINAARAQFAGRARLTPQIAAQGVVDAASFQAPAGFAPGSYITIFGAGLSEATSVFQTPYLALSLAGISVSFDSSPAGIHVPGSLYFVTSGQIDVQIPWELAGLPSATMKVTLSHSASKSVRPGDSLLGTYQSQMATVPIAAYSPAFFEYTESSSGELLAAALDENNALVSSANPARPGQVIQFFVNGLGAVVPGTQPASGEPSPLTVLAKTVETPTVTIGGQASQVQFSGLAPSLIGLYQVNAVVPQGTSAGLQQVSLSLGGVLSKTTLLPVQ